MKKRLEKAPLIYAQAQFFFTDLPSTKLGTEQELEKLHKNMMDIGLADRIDSQVVEMGIQLNKETTDDGYFRISQDKKDMIRLIFTGFGSHLAVEIMRNRITVKTTNYDSYENFKSFVNKVLVTVSKNIKTLKKVLIKQISLRYVDVILPTEQHELKDYIEPALLPYHPKFSSRTIGTSQSISDTGNNRTMVITLEEVQPIKDSIPTQWLPFDLIEIEKKAGLTLSIPLLENYKRGKNYGILSIDHQINFPETPQWAENKMLIALDGLYQLSSDLFWDTLTDTAKDEWGFSNEL